MNNFKILKELIKRFQGVRAVLYFAEIIGMGVADWNFGDSGFKNYRYNYGHCRVKRKFTRHQTGKIYNSYNNI